MSNILLADEEPVSAVIETWRHHVRMYWMMGWASLLPKDVGIQFFVLQKIGKDFGWPFLWRTLCDLTFARDEEGKEFRGFLCTVFTSLFVLLSAVWTLVRFKTFIWATISKATDGIAFRWPNLPPIGLDLQSFLRWGWIAIIIAFLFFGRSKAVEVLTAAITFLVAIAVMIAACYAATIGPAWTGMTTDEYFRFATFLPVVMPVETFMFEVGLFFVGCVLLGLVAGALEAFDSM